MCFSAIWFRDFCIFLVCIIVLIGIVKALLPWLLAKLDTDTGPLIPILRWLLWGGVVIFCIYLVFDLFMCLFAGGLHFPRMGRG